MEEKKTFEQKLHEMKVGDIIYERNNMFLKMPTGWVMTDAIGGNLFIPDVLNIEAHVTNHY